jgi:hypothetical protein
MDRAICHTLLCAKGVVLSVVSKSGRGQYGKNKKSAIKSRAPATAPRITTISVVIAITCSDRLPASAASSNGAPSPIP